MINRIDSEFKLTMINLELKKKVEKEIFLTSKERLVKKKGDEIEHESDSDSDFDSNSDNHSDSEDDLFGRIFRACHDNYFVV